MIEFKPVGISEDYRKKWNVHSSTDFLHIYKDGKKLRDTYYRRGGVGGEFNDGYILILKHTEALYDDEITTDPDRKQHLASQWCIIDENGEEKIVFDEFKYPYLVGGLVYVLDSKYYNAETGELFCYSNTSMKSSKYVFLNNRYDKDKTRRGVWKIDKRTGEVEIFD